MPVGVRYLIETLQLWISMNVERIDSPLDVPHLCFAGDYVTSNYFDEEPISPSLQRHLNAAELAVVNVEAPVDTGSPQPKYGPILSHTAEDIQTVSDGGFDVITLANNHTMDHGVSGLEATINAATAAGLQTVGAGDSTSTAIEPIRQTVAGTTISIFNACQKEFGIASNHTPGAVWIKDPEFESAVKDSADETDFVLVVVHGGTEYVPLPPPSWQQHLRSLAEAGADAIIGHHPHVALPWELYRETPIFYSLGNFAFRDRWRPETLWSYIVDLEIGERSSPEIGVRLVEVENGQVHPMNSRDPEKYWQHLLDLIDLISKAPTKPGYWQAIASQVFEQRYNGRLSDYGNSRLSSIVQHPLFEGDRILRGQLRSADRRQAQQLSVLNYVQNDSHRDVIETALELKSGVVTDHRTAAIEASIEEQFSWVDIRSDWGRLDRLRWYANTIRERLSTN